MKRVSWLVIKSSLSKGKKIKGKVCVESKRENDCSILLISKLYAPMPWEAGPQHM